MNKRFLPLLLVVTLIITSFVGCQKEKEVDNPDSEVVTGNNAGDKKDDNNTREILKMDVIEQVVGNEIVEHPNLVDDILKEKFGLEFKYNSIPNDNLEEQLKIKFSTGKYPHLFWSLQEHLYKQAGMDGLLLPINKYIDKIPNYRNLFSDEEWKFTMENAGLADGNLYYIPNKNPRLVGKSWIYRKGTFDKLGLEIPKTTDELYTALKEIKKAYPDSVPMAYGIVFNLPFWDFQNAFRTRDYLYNDLDTGELVYGPVTDNYRDLTIYLRKLYKEGLLDPNFATNTQEQMDQRFAIGAAHVMHNWNGRVSWANDLVKDVDPDANWTISYDWLTAYPDKKPLADFEMPYWVMGPALTDKCSDEMIDRFLEYINWAVTDEGTIYHMLGKEGVTYKSYDFSVEAKPEYKEGDKLPVQMMPGIQNPITLGDGDPLLKYGIGYYIAQNLDFYKYKGYWDNKVSNAAKENCDSILPMKFNYTEDEQQENADLKVLIDDTRDEWLLKFLVDDNVDPNSDEDWNTYISSLEKVGLQDYIDMHKKILAR